MKDVYTVQIRFYTDTSDKVAWVYEPFLNPLEGLMGCVRQCLTKEQALCVLNKEHPDFLGVFQMSARRTNVMVRKNGKLIKWKHLL